MDARDTLVALTCLIDYFEAGNNDSDEAAKAILASDSRFTEYWYPAIKRFRTSADWTGLRGPEAELLANRLRSARELIDAKK
jgi:hypothetical protein